MHNWHTTQLDYVLAYPQALIEKPLFVRIPKGFKVEGGSNNDHILRLKHNIYGQKQAGQVWNNYLVAKLKKIGFIQSLHDPCIFYKGTVLYAL